jgi:outer membrane protein OmpA-like peptidoglycan-associated protein
MQVARNALKLKGYLLEVKGYTDSDGHPAMNQDLSMRRAESVVAFLQQYGSVPLTHVLTPGAMGETSPAASNETSQGRAENRRAEVKILVNRGLSGD